MLLPLAVALGSVATGSALAFVPGAARRILGPGRTFALTAAVSVVLMHLLPEAFESLGIWSLVGLGIGLFVPLASEKLNHKIIAQKASSDSGWRDFASRFTFAGLLVHQVGDGMGLTAYGRPNHTSLDVAIVLGAHTVPLTMLVVLGPLAKGERRAALTRAALMALATVAGVLVGFLVPAATLDHIAPWTAAIASGLLLHILGHGVFHDLPETASERTVDLIAGAAGIGLTFIGAMMSDSTANGSESLRHAFTQSLLHLVMESAPMLLLGLILGALVHALGGYIPSRLLTSKTRLGSALRGAALGAPIPVCACGILPVAKSLQQRGATSAFVVAFMLATPELGLDTFALTTKFFGAQFAVARVLLAVILAIFGALALSFSRPWDGSATAPAIDAVEADANKEPVLRRGLTAFDELLFHIGPWVFVGLIGAAFIDVCVPAASLAPLAASGLDIFVVALIAVPSYVCATSTTPLAAMLITRGISPGAVLAGLLLGPATNIATVVFLRKEYGQRAAAATMFTVIAVSLASAWIVNHVIVLHPVLLATQGDVHAHSVFAQLCALILGAALLRGIWQSGLRAWVGSLGVLGSAPNESSAFRDPACDLNPEVCCTIDHYEHEAHAHSDHDHSGHDHDHHEHGPTAHHHHGHEEVAQTPVLDHSHDHHDHGPDHHDHGHKHHDHAHDHSHDHHDHGHDHD